MAVGRPRGGSALLEIGRLMAEVVKQGALVLQHPEVMLPSREPLHWTKGALTTCPNTLYHHLPHTAPISEFRGRFLAKRLHLLLPDDGPCQERQQELQQQHHHHHQHDSISRDTHASLMQLRYCLAGPAPSSAHAEPHPLLLVDEYVPVMAAPTAAGGPRRAYNKPLFTEDFDTFAADVAVRHVSNRDCAFVTAHLDSLTWFEHTYQPQLLAPTPSQLSTDTAAVPAMLERYRSSREVSSNGNGLSPNQGDQHSSHGQQQQQQQLRCQPPQQQVLAGQPVNTDLYMTGQCTWVGRSSIEVTVELTRGRPLGAPPTQWLPDQQQQQQQQQQLQQQLPLQHDGEQQQAPAGSSLAAAPPGSNPQTAVLVARARFIMACRDASLRKSVPAPGLQVCSPLEQQLYEEAAARQQVRQAGRKRTEHDDMEALRDLLAAIVDKNSHNSSSTCSSSSSSDQYGTTSSSNGRREAVCSEPVMASLAEVSSAQAGQHLSASLQDHGPHSMDPHQLLASIRALAGTMAGARSVASTYLSQSCITQYRDRNTTGTVFGGTLLRYGLEVGEAVAAAHVGAPAAHVGGPAAHMGGPDLPAREDLLDLVVLRDVAFLSLVPLQHLLQLSGQVVATRGQLVVVKAAAFKGGDVEQPPVHHAHSSQVHGHGSHSHDTQGDPSPTQSPQEPEQAQGQQPDAQQQQQQQQQQQHRHHHHAGRPQQHHHQQQQQQKQQPPQAQTQTHQYWLIYRAHEGVVVPPVLPASLPELRDWLHGLHLCQNL